MPSRQLDDFEDLAGWSAITSGWAQLAISREQTPQGAAMRLDFDFKGGGGFVVARKSFALSMPESYALSFAIRGSAPANKLELKLADPSGRNVWWYRQDAFDFPAEWRRLRIRSSEIDFAWGPAGGGTLKELGAIEIAIAAGPGGEGTVWIEDMRFEDTTFSSIPVVRASGCVPGHEPQAAVDRSPATSWRSAPSVAPHWLTMDFEEQREYGGLVIDWETDTGAAAFDVQISEDAVAWKTVYSAPYAAGRRSYVYLPNTVSRHLRLELREAVPGAGIGIVDIDVKPYDFSRSINTFFSNVARDERKGTYPRYLYGEQAYWTPIGIEGGAAPALLNEDGMVEVHKGGWSLEPFLYIDNELVTWADATVSQDLAEGFLPLPSSVWRKGDLELRTTVFTSAAPGPAAVWVRYRLASTSHRVQRGRLFVAVRPFQVTPPWQAFQNLGGVSSIRELSYSADILWVNGDQAVVPVGEPSGFGAAAFEQGAITEYLERGELPPATAIVDDFGYASGALCFDIDLAVVGAAHEVFVAIPFAAGGVVVSELTLLRGIEGRECLQAAARDWRHKLAPTEFHVPDAACRCVDALKTATAHVLINRDGVALQPGPRRYTRSWIRDAATMGAALLRMGCAREVRDFIRWYVPHQNADGNVPCCVDGNGPDWLAEHDSHGQLIYLIAEYFRFSGDRDFVAETWPAVLKAADYLEALRQQRLSPDLLSGEQKACYGLLPESVSHEGYLAHPVHAYWDDFWALRGLSDATQLGDVVGDRSQANRLASLRASFRETLYASIEVTIAERNIAYVPGSVEWADFDPTATATAIATTDAAVRLPAAALTYTYDEYLGGFRKRRRGEIDWNNYTPYEIRTIGALVRLGRRQEAYELLEFFLDDRRPAAWNQWPEIAWRDPRSPGHIGDVPHTWIGAEYVLAVLGLFAYEREADAALVVAAGIPQEWLDAGVDVGVERLPTYYGALTYSLRRDGDDAVQVSLHGDIAVPPGGLILAPPLPRALRSVEVDGEKITTFDARSVTVRSCPAEVLMRF